MSYEVHQRELWIKIGLIVNSHPEVSEWTPEMLAKELGIAVGSPGFQRILEVLSQAEFAEQEERKKIKMGFVS